MITKKFLKRINNSFFRFLLIGFVNTAAGLSTTLCMLNLAGFSYWASTFIGNAAGACISYFLNRTFTFRSNVSSQSGMPKFFATILICYFCSYYLSEKLVLSISYLQLISPQNIHIYSVLLGSIFYTGSNYLGQKFFVFKKITTAKTG